jgi:hypothetical protein
MVVINDFKTNGSINILRVELDLAEKSVEVFNKCKFDGINIYLKGARWPLGALGMR